MTEAGWLTCTDPQRLLDCVRGQATERKLRLFACACARRFWALLPDPRSRRVVELTERYVDGQATETDLRSAAWDARAAWAARFAGTREADTAEVAADLAWRGARASAMVVAIGWAFNAAGGPGHPFKDPEFQCQVLRDLFLPFDSAQVEPAWSTPTVQALARTVYEDQQVSLLPVLGDALEEAGCTEEHWLNHCRQADLHARGCWLVDALLVRA